MKVGLIVLGVVIAIIAVLNHFVFKANPVAHTSTILVSVGFVVAVTGLILTFAGSKD